METAFVINLISVDSKLYNALKELGQLSVQFRLPQLRASSPQRLVHLHGHFPALGPGSLGLPYANQGSAREIWESCWLARPDLLRWQRMLLGSFPSKIRSSLSRFLNSFWLITPCLSGPVRLGQSSQMHTSSLYSDMYYIPVIGTLPEPCLPGILECAAPILYILKNTCFTKYGTKCNSYW